MPTLDNRASFEILPGNPKSISTVIGVASDLSEAIELCFPMDADAEMYWGDTRVPINYKYDLSVVFEDIVALLNICLKDEPGQVHFGSNTFCGTLSVWPVKGAYRVRGKWNAVSGNKEAQLNNTSELMVDRASFLRSWSKPLALVLQVVEQSSLRAKLRVEIEQLRQLLARVNEAI